MDSLNALETFKAVQKYDDHIHKINEFENHECPEYGCTERASLWTIQRGKVANAIKILEGEFN